MPIIAQYIAIALTGILAFLAGSFADFSEYIVWMYEDPNWGSSIVSQKLTGTTADYYKQNMALHRTAVDLVHKMSLEQKAGQLLMPAWEKGTDLEEIIAVAQKYSLGGIMVLRNDATVEEVQTLTQAFKQNIGQTQLDVFMSIDAEPSLLRYRIPSAGYATQTKDLNTEALAYNAGVEIAAIISAYGYNYNFAPIYDTGVNKAIIGDRAFGTDTEDIHLRAQAFTRSMTENNIVATAKHFPGHGAVLGDTHKNLQTVPGDLPEQEAFRLAIQSRVPSIMVGHLAVGAGEYDTQGVPASISPIITTGLLREEMGYRGLIITDGMVMGALDGFGDVDIKAIEAGADIVLMPRDLEGTYKKLVDTMTTSSQFEEQVNDKVYRIVRMKLTQQWAGK